VVFWLLIAEEAEERGHCLESTSTTSALRAFRAFRAFRDFDQKI
jgi:hypothetical protein